MNIVEAIIFAYALMLVVTGQNLIEPQEIDFSQASERCFAEDRISSSYKSQFNNFQYADEPVVHRFLRCVWMSMNLWNDRSGFNIERIAQLYNDKANTEVLIPILSACNENRRHEPVLTWCYRASICILDSRVGQWFKNDVKKKQLNGH